MKGRDNSFVISGQLLSPVLLLLLSSLWRIGGGCVLGLGEESSQIMENLPDAHRERLELLTTVLAMDEQWSAVRSEKLKPDLAVKSDLEIEFCPKISDLRNGLIDAIDISKKIMEHCPHSGMYVEFAVQALAHSTQCLFNRHARLQLATMIVINIENFKHLASNLKNLVNGYQLIANLMASIGAELHTLIALVRIFDVVGKQLASDIGPKNNLDKFKNSISELVELLEQSEMYCETTLPDISVGQDSTEAVIHNMTQITEKYLSEYKNEVSSMDNQQPPVDDLNNSLVNEAGNLRKKFEKLLLGKFPLEVWKLIFEIKTLDIPT